MEGLLKVRYIEPDGTIDRNDESPEGYTQERPISISDKEVVTFGWGCAEGACWTAGTYRIEFWFAERKIGEKSFTVL